MLLLRLGDSWDLRVGGFPIAAIGMFTPPRLSHPAHFVSIQVQGAGLVVDSGS